MRTNHRPLKRVEYVTHSVLPSETQPAGQGSESTAENGDSQDSPQTYRTRISGGGPSNVCFNKPSR